eukprot:TRINITY_DN2180_c0_g2_i1.p1 TRINITY_DN2180_c0_g2~~TRINITY_DN2180_c0_g2_i1.p1  ORF type:complete len:384 (+),score=155.17 TRINITY_DN2180_c0_g2_i1:338-1489(+)
MLPHHKQKVILATQFLQRELPVRLAHAVMMFYHLPYIASVNPYLLEVMLTYLHTFERLRVVPVVATYADAKEYLSYVLHLSQIHKNVYKTLSTGIAEVKLQQLGIDDSELDAFMNGFMRARLSRRVLIAHQVKLYQAYETVASGGQPNPNCVGVFDQKCSPLEVVTRAAGVVSNICNDRFGRHPEVQFSGVLDTTLTYIPDHLEYLCVELLKNAMRHQVKWAMFHEQEEIPPIRIKICPVQAYGAIIKVCDQAGGFGDNALDTAWQWGGRQKCDTGSLDIPSQLTKQLTHRRVAEVIQEKNVEILSKMAEAVQDPPEGDFLRDWLFREHESDLGALTTSHTGLPSARTYARYLGGDLVLESIKGFGTTCYVYLSSVDAESVRF